MNTFEPLTHAQLSRRVMLKGMGALGAAAALASISGGGQVAAQSTSIQDILNITTTVEMFGVTILGAGLDSNEKGNFNPPIPPAVVAIVTAARAQEQAHLEFFQGLGGQALTDTFHIPDPAILTDPSVFFDAVQAEETREIACQVAAFTTFVELNRPDLVKVSFQYAAEEAEHRVLANYAAGARPANNYAFSPALYDSPFGIIDELTQIGIIDGSGPPATYPGPGTIDASNVINTTPDGSEVTCGAMTMPNTGSGTGASDGDAQNLARFFGLGSLGVAATALAVRMRQNAAAPTVERDDFTT